MPFTYTAVDTLQNTPLVGGGDCVDLIKELAPGLRGRPTSSWKPGALVIDSPGLRRGTAIATFVDGRYPNNRTGQHAAFFLARAGAGFWVMDQWRADGRKPRVSKRYIAPGAMTGVHSNLSNRADAFYVIELR